MPSSSTLGTVIGIVFALGIVALLVWYLGKKKPTFKYNKGLIVFECELSAPDPNKPIVNTGQCKIKPAPGTGGINQTFPSMDACQKQCGTFWGCQPALGPGTGICETVGNNCTTAYKENRSLCESECQFGPTPEPNVSSGRYLIQSTLNGKLGLQDSPAYLVTKLVTQGTPPQTSVVALVDPDATINDADVWTFDQGAGTLMTNKKYPSLFQNQDLYLAVTTSSPPDRNVEGGYILMQPLTGSEFSAYTKGWFLTVDAINGGRIATPWAPDSAYDYLCVGSIYPTSNPIGQPSQPCRLQNLSYGFKFIPVT